MATPDEEYGRLQYYHGQNSLKYEWYEQAIRFFTVAIQYNIELPNSYRGIAKAQKGLGDYDSAIENYKKVIELEPNDAIAYNNLGNIYYKIGKYTDAICAYDKALSIDKNLSIAFSNRNKAYTKNEEECEIKKTQANVYYKKGQDFFNNKNYQQAIIEFSNAIKIWECSKYSYDRGLAYQKMNDMDNAIRDFENASLWNGVENLFDADEMENFKQKCNLKILECRGVKVNTKSKTSNNHKKATNKTNTNSKINLETCTKKDLLKFGCFDEIKAKKLLQYRKEGKKYYDIDTLATDLELQPHEILELEGNIIFPQKPKNKFGRKVDW